MIGSFTACPPCLVPLGMSALTHSLITAGAIGVACAVLSVFVVLRRWAFIGEGIAHAGFGGAGTAWILSLLFPSVAYFSQPSGIYLCAVTFALLVAVGIAWVTQREQVHADTAIGIFLVASLGWGFVAYGIHLKLRNGKPPPEWGDYLLGRMEIMPSHYTVGAVIVCVAVLAVMALLGKEVLAYAFDPGLARAGGVRVGLIHHLLILLVALTIVFGMRLMGSLMVTGLLVLPGATALLLSRRLRRVIIMAVVVGLIGALAGPLVHFNWGFIPQGPAIVLTLVAEFLLVFAARGMLQQGD